MKKALLIILPIILALTATLTVILIKNFDDSDDEQSRKSSKKDDLKNHTIVLEAQTDGAELTETEIEKTVEIIKSRLKESPAKNIKVTQSGSQFSVSYDLDNKSTFLESEEAVNSFFESNVLTFREDFNENGAIILTNEDIAKAYPNLDPDNGTNIVSIEFTEEGKLKFAEATRRLVGRQISIWLDKTCISSPTVNSVIDGGTCYINGMANAEEAEDLAEKLNSEPLPYSMSVISFE